MELSKQEAEAEAIRRWYRLPPHQRQTCEDAEAYAIRLDQTLEFKAVTNRARLIGAWLIREMFRARDAGANDEIEAFQQALKGDDDQLVMPPDVDDQAA
jgi:hypothetical protein